MKKSLFVAIALLMCNLALAADKVPAHPHIEIVTTEGTIKLELDGKQAPITVARVLELVDNGYYDGKVFHRVIPGFMIQGGGYTPSLKLHEPAEPIANESGNGLSNVRGTIVMARTVDPHSAISQFFINVADNERLDPSKSAYNGNWGYTVFGIVIEGMDIVDKIANVQAGPGGEFSSDVPVIPVVIKKISRITYE